MSGKLVHIGSAMLFVGAPLFDVFGLHLIWMAVLPFAALGLKEIIEDDYFQRVTRHAWLIHTRRLEPRHD